MGKITMVCENKVVTDEAFIEAFGVTREELKELQRSNKKRGSFEYEFVTEVFKFYLLGEKKQAKVVENAILFPKVLGDGTKRKYYITDMKYDKHKPPNNTYKTMLTVYGEKMLLKEFLERAGLYGSFFRNNKMHDASSFKINGTFVKVDRVVKNILRFNVTNKETGEKYPNLYKKEVMALTGCPKNKTSQATKYCPVTNYLNYRIERIYK